MNDPVQEPPQKFINIKFIAVLLGYIVIGLSLLTVSLVTYWSFQNPAILSAKNAPFPVRPEHNTPGNIEFVHINYCKTYSASGTVVLTMVGKISIIRLQFPIENSPKQCLNTDVPIVIPLYAVKDTYYFDFKITYRVNPIKTKIVEFKSQSFNLTTQKIVVE